MWIRCTENISKCFMHVIKRLKKEKLQVEIDFKANIISSNLTEMLNEDIEKDTKKHLVSLM